MRSTENRLLDPLENRVGMALRIARCPENLIVWLGNWDRWMTNTNNHAPGRPYVGGNDA